MIPVTNDVNPGRRDGRRERSQRTRDKILRAAFDRFASDGYAATLDAIAADAGVAMQTVKFVFHTKAALLLEVIGAVATDRKARSTDQQPWFIEASSTANGHRALALMVEHGTGIYERLAPLVGTIATAAMVDEHVAERRAATAASRRVGMHRITSHLHERGDLNSRLDVEKATDVVFVLQSPETFHTFIQTCGWPMSTYKAWLYDTLSAQLLASTSRASRKAATKDLSFSALVE
jgi:AcrR family transcriptional regulator